jgi:hypothetical protein
MMHSDSNEDLKGFIVGIFGGAVGLLAMRWYWQKAAPIIQGRGEENQNEEQLDKPLIKQAGKYEDISIYGPKYQENESATGALGRILYTGIAGKEPQAKETKTLLSYLVHWVYGLAQGGVYGANRGKVEVLDVNGGILFGSALWLFGDEMAVPLLGLQQGPGGVTLRQHINRLGAHWVYGLGTAITTQLLRRII